jgi:endonuclease/exonuclease/phosphatase (EEP) superfamily protein YafD
MSPVRILAAATAIETCFASAAVALLAACGAFSGWLDLVNCVAPLLLASGPAGALLAGAALDRGRFRAACIVLGAAAAVYGGLMVIPEAAAVRPRPSPGAPVYRIVSANLFRDNVMPLAAARAVTSPDADALLLQETDSVAFTARSKAVLQSRYPYASTCPGATVEIRLKAPPLAQGCGLQDSRSGYHAWRAAFAWVRAPGPGGRPVVLATVHLERPYPPERQALQRRLLAQALRLAPKGDPVILAGDFNTVPWSFGMWRQDRLLQPLRRWTHLQPTYPAQINTTFTPWPLPVLPIDHLYASAQWTPVRVARIRTPGSDHFGLQADLALAP